MFRTEKQKRGEEAKLLAAIHEKLGDLDKLLEKCSGQWGYEDPIYRFYHQSFKVYALQETTQEIVANLEVLAPHLELNLDFTEIIEQGTGKVFSIEHNDNWLAITRPIVEAFFHARYMLEMVCKYGRNL